LSSDLMYVCKTCKQPLRVLLECLACGNKLVLTQDEYRAAAPSGKHCPVCMELVTG
jgi:hypothetical protein